MIKSFLVRYVKSPRLPYILASILFTGISFLFYFPVIGFLPRGIHEWAQADRLSLAITFYDFGLDFFHPRTLSFDSIDGITGVEFPIQAYLAAVLGHIFGRSSIPALFRCVTITFAISGYFYLFRIVFERTGSFFAALIPAFFLLASPVFSYYSGNYLPDPASTALVFVGFYYIQRYLFNGYYFNQLIIGIVFLTLATLVKSSSAIYLGSTLAALLLLTYLNNSIFSLRQKIWLLLSAGASLMTIALHMIYINYLNVKYESQTFLISPRPIEDPEMRTIIWVRINELWKYEYFSFLDYGIMKASLIVLIIYLILNLKNSIKFYYIMFFSFVAIFGAKLFFELMGTQFHDHDYYIISPFMPLAVVLIILAIIVAEKYAIIKKYLFVMWIPLAVALGITGFTQHRARTHEPYKSFSPNYHYRWMQGGAAALQAVGVPPTARIFVLGDSAPNLSLVYFGRRGLVWNGEPFGMPTAEIQLRMVAHELQYLVMSQDAFEKFAPNHAQFLATCKRTTASLSFVVLEPDLSGQHW